VACTAFELTNEIGAWPLTKIDAQDYAILDAPKMVIIGISRERKSQSARLLCASMM